LPKVNNLNPPGRAGNGVFSFGKIQIEFPGRFEYKDGSLFEAAGVDLGLDFGINGS
jgi:hypothetical protein